jgi:hypothetical protein
MKTFLLVSCIIAFAAALPTEDAVVPEQALFEAVDADFEATRTELEQLRAKGTSDKECRKLADATEDDVKASVKAQQDALDAIDKGEKCPSKHSKEVADALKQLNKAKSDKKKADDAYAKAKKTKINFGDFTYDQLTPGQCGSFFNQAVYKNAATSVKSAKAKADKAAGSLSASQKAYDNAVADQKRAINKCHCDVKKLQKATLEKMNSAVKVANEKLYKKAADLRCLLDGTPAGKCKVASVPVVVPVKVTTATAAAKCGPTGLVTFTGLSAYMKSCGAGCVYKNGGGNSWDSDAQSTQWLKKDQYQDNGYGFCASRGASYSSNWNHAMIGFDSADNSNSYSDINFAMYADSSNYFRVYYDGSAKYNGKPSSWAMGDQACMWITKTQVRFWVNYNNIGWHNVYNTNSNPSSNYRIDAAMYSPFSQFSDVYWIDAEPIKGSKAKPPKA